MSRPHIRLDLPQQDKVILQSWLRASNTKRILAERAQMILLCGGGFTASEVSQELSKRLGSVQKWRKRYLELGLSGLADQPRSGRPRRLSPSKVRKILKATVQTIPRESTHWSLRLMAEYAQVSKHQVTEIWKAADLKPHRIRSFKISNDPDFAEKVIDVVGLYMDPPDNALVLSVDEINSDSGSGPNPAHASAQTRAGRTQNPRLQTPRDRQSVRRLRRGQR